MDWNESKSSPLDDFKEGVRLASKQRGQEPRMLILTANEKRRLDNALRCKVRTKTCKRLQGEIDAK